MNNNLYDIDIVSERLGVTPAIVRRYICGLGRAWRLAWPPGPLNRGRSGATAQDRALVPRAWSQLQETTAAPVHHDRLHEATTVAVDERLDRVFVACLDHDNVHGLGEGAGAVSVLDATK
jgi:hypothetical protein